MAPRAATARTWHLITPSSHKACWCWARSRYRLWGERWWWCWLQGEDPQNLRLGQRKESEGVGREGREERGSRKRSGRELEREVVPPEE